MKTLGITATLKNIGIFLSLSFFVFSSAVFADDTCIFSVTSNEVGPNIVFLIDNGAEMEQVTWHHAYKNGTDYTPTVTAAWDVLDAASTGVAPESSSNTILVLTGVDETDYPFEVNADIIGLTSGAEANVLTKTYNGATLELEVDNIRGAFQTSEIVQRYKNSQNIAFGTIDRIEVPTPPPVGGTLPGAPNGFFNKYGYAIVEHGGTYFLVKIMDNLLPEDYLKGLPADSGNQWTINGKTLTLPAVPNAAAVTDPDTGLEIRDTAARFRYSKNYLNWLFFADDGTTPAPADLYSGDGSDLSSKSQFYYAKQALLLVGKLTSNKASFGIYSFTNDEGASSVQPLGKVVATVDPTDPNNNVLTPNYLNNISTMVTTTYSPLAEGLVSVGRYFNSASIGIDKDLYCQDQYVIVVSSGVSSKDLTFDGGSLCNSCILPGNFTDWDGDDSGIGEGDVKADGTQLHIPLNIEGSTWLDDVAHFMYSNDMVGYVDGFQRIHTYTVGTMTSRESHLFLMNTSHNGNGQTNLYDTKHEKYEDYHFTADSPEGLGAAILNAINAILTNTSTFTAPVVPVTRTLSGNRIYLALFKPGEGNFWEGDVLKFGINLDLQIVDKTGAAATFSNGALKETAIPYWSTKNWSNANFSAPTCTGEGCNFLLNGARNIYTYLGATDLTDGSNRFHKDNIALTIAKLGNPATGRPTVIDYIRGADALDDDKDGNILENRDLFTGDVLHSEPVVFEYKYPDNSADTYVFFGSNDGMLHAVLDQSDPDVDVFDDEIDFGTEAWGFIHPDHLSRLKEMVEGFGHQIFLDSSPQIYFKDDNNNGIVDSGDQVILVCGMRGGGTGYFALDITNPVAPEFMWKVDDTIITELGKTWSEPQFGRVKTSAADTTGTMVMFVGGGYDAGNSKGNAVIALNIFNGSEVNKWSSTDNASMIYSIPSTIKLIDENDNRFVDKLYVGDMGGQVWRIGNCGSTFFPGCEENINTWTTQTILKTDNAAYQQKFFYPPSVTLEKGYDLILIGSGDRENPCIDATPAGESDSIYSFKDSHTTDTWELNDLVDVTLTASDPPDLDDEDSDADNNLLDDKGWYIDLDPDGEKILAQGTVFYKTLYITSYIPNDDPCLPGGESRLYALNYKTGEAVLPLTGADNDLDGEPDLVRSTSIGGGIPSKPVMVISEKGQKLFISVGSTEIDPDSTSLEAGIIAVDPLAPPKNFFYLWWQELLN